MIFVIYLSDEQNKKDYFRLKAITHIIFVKIL